MSETEPDMDWEIGEGDACSWCGVEHELVRPGKTQPRCNCHEDRATIQGLRIDLSDTRRAALEECAEMAKAEKAKWLEIMNKGTATRNYWGIRR